MQNIFINGEQVTIKELVDIFRDGKEYDYDALGDVLDSDTLTAAMNNFTESYDMFELVKKYLEIAEKPIDFEFPIPKLRVD